MAIRRSARLRDRSTSAEPQATPEPTTNNNTTSKNNVNNNKDAPSNRHQTDKLPSVMEHDETPALEDFPVVPKHAPGTPLKSTPLKSTTPKPTLKSTPLKSTPLKSTPLKSIQRSPAKTPTSVFTRPPHQEMHPSKVHQSTTKQADSGLILGFNPIKKDASGNVVKNNVQDTPTKANASPASTHFGTPGFEFKFASQESELSDEARKLMESVRGDVAKIKAQMIQNQASEPEHELQSADRIFAHPKGQASRFSNAHMAEFKKMDSIAGHASAFRATPGRFQPLQKTLKRTNSKARLDEPESQGSPSKSARKPSPADAPAAGAKRVKHDSSDDASTRRPTTADTPSKPVQARPRPRPRSTVRSSLLTPTRASSMRAATSLKPPRTSMIPSLARSPISKPSDAPHTPRTEFNPRFKSNLPSLGNLKSILRRHQPLFSRDPAKIASGTHVAAPDFTSSMIFGAPREDGSDELARTPSPKKRVEFNFSTNAPEGPPESPSPSKIPKSARSLEPVSTDVVYPTLPTLTPERGSTEVQSPSIRHVRPSDVTIDTQLPEVSGIPHGIRHKKGNHETSEAPRDPNGPDIAGIPHGIGHRKRVREDVDDEVDTENVPPEEPVEGRSIKRVKLVPTPAKLAPNPSKLAPTPSKLAPTPSKPAPTPSKLAPTPAKPSSSPFKSRSHTPQRSNSITSKGTPSSARPKSRGALSMSRLNMLSQPKSRP
ncbi:hypothetical protein P168DRAFT_310866 [Aspergillus campestris IBT 28561]|uniref:Erythromycin esterase n=1 Tax=Aspergillus campestris (strain IBT 28561) TaxID=1392248 RepID=A0A2I1D2Y9_ASPC2|nr:uncharacterized protein P168DRAFT_310866 [Aspergillus campestris IBT 28561]PKY04235.1 hypothetical protein P168DRAFT_310866 [Aspergillus campestris IBT 28561]